MLFSRLFTHKVLNISHLVEAVATERSGGRPINPASDLKRGGSLMAHKRKLADEHRKADRLRLWSVKVRDLHLLLSTYPVV